MPLLIGLGVVVLLVLIWYVSASNSLKRSVVKIDEATSGIDVALTKRFDVLTKMLDITKAYAAHERATITETINLRKGMSIAEKTEANRKMDSMANGINVVAEAYPELRSNENFKQLQISVSDVEEHLQAARRLYNGNVSAFNQAIVVFPKSIVAEMMKLVRKEFFQADEFKKSDVEMKF